MGKNWNDLIKLAESANHNDPPAIQKHETWKPPVNPLIPRGDKKRLTHDDAALIFAEKCSNLFKYVPEKNSWYVWNEHVWEVDKTGQVSEYMKIVLRNMRYEMEHVYMNTPKEQRGKKPQTDRLLMNGFLAGSLSMASTDSRFSVPFEAFDANPYEINTPSGVVSLITGEIRPPQPGELLMRSTEISPKHMDTPLFDNFLAETFLGDKELETYVQRMIGASLIANQDEQVFMYLRGAGGNGKGTLMTVVQELIGVGESGYAISVDSSILIQQNFQSHPTEIAQFAGARMVVTSEVPQGAKFDTVKMKKLVSGEYLTGRFMRGDFFNFVPTHTLWVMANDRLAVPHDDKAFWRRLREIPFLFTPEPGSVIKGLAESLVAEEGPGILQWIIDGAVDYLADGYDVPDSVTEANENYREQQNTISYFLENFVDYEADRRSPARSVRAQYEIACKQMGATPLRVSDMKKALEEAGYPQKKFNTGLHYLNMSLLQQ